MHLCAVFKLLKVLSLIDGIGLLSPNTKMFKDFNPLFSESKVKYRQIYWLIFGSIAQLLKIRNFCLLSLGLEFKGPV